jgi:hypothetical protein
MTSRSVLKGGQLASGSAASASSSSLNSRFAAAGRDVTCDRLMMRSRACPFCRSPGRPRSPRPDRSRGLLEITRARRCEHKREYQRPEQQDHAKHCCRDARKRYRQGGRANSGPANAVDQVEPPHSSAVERCVAHRFQAGQPCLQVRLEGFLDTAARPHRARRRPPAGQRDVRRRAGQAQVPREIAHGHCSGGDYLRKRMATPTKGTIHCKFIIFKALKKGGFSDR